MRLATSSTSEGAAALPLPWVERIFARLTAFYGTKFLQQWSGLNADAIKATWAEELAGFTGEELARGLDACRSRDWPPSLPEFLRLCRPPIDELAAWYEAQVCCKARDLGEAGAWSNPAIFHAYVEMAWEVRTGEWAKHGDRWREVLARAVRDVAGGKLAASVPAPPQALPAPEPMSREEASRRAAELQIAMARPARVDAKDWARRLKAREEGGERLSHYSRHAWRAALRVPLEAKGPA